MELVIIQREEFDQITSKLDSLNQAVNALLIGEVDHKLLTNKQVKQMLNVSSRTLQTYRDTGKIEFSQIGRKIIYTNKAIEQFVETFRLPLIKQKKY